ncbi:ubiquitin carboxyl-terminal hydrolase 19 [Colletotrichum truncatum]|uniref:Ubiquitin carboxyl-terminal hydrolase 19 n=1 Tax=Colletotrichum truncatum TaxID=5467 RepID=A0ACC3YIC5_COLTU|nr:ubiquitin carboxyl-terminal hydrolase 19 [Colletotrichum truncatum]KAF6794486.1 ubiquitin carboxyl-terminal hydrolase 19 [Colletotrichum truncatum]
MDHRFPIARDDFFNIQMDLKQIQLVQNNQGERLARLERRQDQDASLKSVWQQHPFPGVLAGTPQQGPTHISPNDMFDDFDEQGQHLLSSLHLGPTEEEPTRRGAASRANSVRFDESALRGADWASQSNRHSGEFAPPRPSSGLMMERSLSHKSDGRHSSAGHSVHSFHSVASGRASSLGLDTNFIVSSHEDDSPLDMPEPPPGLFILGSVPTIIRCWLTTQFAHNTILYADLCTGSQKSVLDYSIVRDLDLLEEVQRDVDGTYKIRLPVYLVEATVSERSSRSSSPGHQIPSIQTTFEISGVDHIEGAEPKRGIQIFIGSDTLRAHQADILLSQNRMCLYGSEREKLSVPFVRPEDDTVFKHISTTNVVPDKPRLNANAAPFVSGEPRSRAASTMEDMENSVSSVQPEDAESQGLVSPLEDHSIPNKSIGASNLSESGGESERPGKDTASGSESGAREVSAVQNGSASTDSNRRESASGIWGSWRQGTSTNGAENGQRDVNGPLSGYQPAGRGGRNMKVLKPLKSGSSSSARTGAAYELPPAPRTSGEHRRKSQVSVAADNGPSGTVRWEAKRTVSSAGESKAQREAKNAAAPLPRSANPIGGASAFSWMNPASKVKPTATAE